MRWEQSDDELVPDFRAYGGQEYLLGPFESSFWQ